MDRLLALFTFAVFLVFLGILALKVGEWDLKAIILLTVVLVAYDFWTTGKKKKNED
jgi:cbb3-type cytochrome oxidase subunit 3